MNSVEAYSGGLSLVESSCGNSGATTSVKQDWRTGAGPGPFDVGDREVTLRKGLWKDIFGLTLTLLNEIVLGGR